MKNALKNLSRVLDEARETVKVDLDQTESVFEERLSSSQVDLAENSRRILRAGGKRLRPIISLLSARAWAPAFDNAWRVAVAAEFIHTATLIHDDFIDDAVERRGIRTLHVSRGKRAAVLTGDFLIALAFRELAGTSALAPAAEAMGDTLAAMAEGELLEESATWRLDLPADERLHINSLKSASMFSWCSLAGGLAAGATPSALQGLNLFGRKLGEAFQLFDDVLDWMADADTVGKPVWQDIVHGRMTLPLILGIARDDEIARIIDVLRHQPLEMEGRGRIIESIYDRMVDCEAIADTLRRAAAKAGESLEGLEPLPDNQYRRDLENLAGALKQLD